MVQESEAEMRKEFLASHMHLIKRRKNNCETLSSTQSTPNTELRKTSGLDGNRERMESGVLAIKSGLTAERARGT